jgi:hypothetical protein
VVTLVLKVSKVWLVLKVEQDIQARKVLKGNKDQLVLKVKKDYKE